MKLLQFLLNFIGNAVKFTPAERCITLEMVKKESLLQFGISDNGPGLRLYIPTKGNVSAEIELEDATSFLFSLSLFSK
jgi:signal transduction histidine kinase